jgi:hypothetical protein
MVQGAYDSEDLIDSWTLTPEDHVRIAGKSRDNRLAFAVLLLFFRANGRFPDVAEIHPSIVALVAQQLGDGILRRSLLRVSPTKTDFCFFAVLMASQNEASIWVIS